MLYKMTRSWPVCRDVTPLTFEAPFLPHPPSGRSLLRANRRRRRDAKPRGLALRDSPAAGGSNPAPRPDTRARGFFRLPASADSSCSHRVLGRTMSGRRSPPRGNSGGFAFDVVADPPTMLAAVLDEDLVSVEPGGEHAGDVHTRHVRLHRVGRVLRDAAGIVHRYADRPEQREVCSIARQGQDEIRGNRFAVPVRIATHHDV